MTDDQICALLPGVYYMNPPDGGNVTLLEQLQRMAKDAERYRWLRDVGDATWRPFSRREGYSAEMADKAIDAAMAADAERDGLLPKDEE